MNWSLRLINTALMSITLSCIMTLYITWVNLGLRPDFMNFWLKAWVMAAPAAFVIVLVIATPIQKLSKAIHGKLFE